MRLFHLVVVALISLLVASCDNAASSLGRSDQVPDQVTNSTSTKLSGVLVQAGDSIGTGYLSNGYAAIDHLNFGPDVQVTNASVGGRTMADGNANSSSEIFANCHPRTTCVLLIEQGTNDLGAGTSAATLYNDVASSFIASAQAAGFYVAINTILPRSDVLWNSDKEIQRKIYNNLVRANSAGADAINDTMIDHELGKFNKTPSIFYTLDGLHLTEAGQKRLAKIDEKTLRPLLSRAPRGE